jgi:hypothetical protein
MIKQTNTATPSTFVWAGYLAIRTGVQRFGGYQHFVRTTEGVMTIYARRDLNGLLEIFTGMADWQPRWKRADITRLDDAVMYPQGMEKGPLDAFTLLEA